MNITILSLRKKKSDILISLEHDYIKRLSKYIKVVFNDIPRIKISAETHKIIDADTKRISAAIPKDSFLVILSSRGKLFTTKEFSNVISKQMHQGARNITFVIGGPMGLSESIEKNADLLFSLSRLTLPHELARLFLIEAIYRCFDIIHGGPYHK